MLVWTEFAGYDGNTSYEAESKVYNSYDAGELATWEISPAMKNNRVVWQLVMSDEDLLLGDDTDLDFDSVEAAKAHCQAREDQYLASNP